MNERLSAMRCLFCNAEMVLMEAVQADPTTLPSFEHRTFLCPACHRVERRLAFRCESTFSHISLGFARHHWKRDVPACLEQSG